MASLTVTIAASTRTPLAKGTSIVLEQKRSTAKLVINDLTSSISISVLDTVVVDDGTNNLFSGYVLRVRKTGIDDGKRQLALDCVSTAWRFGHPASLISASYSNDSDQNIAIALVTEAGLASEFTATTATVDSTKTGITTSFGPRATLAEALDQLAEMTGASWWVDADDTLHWNTDANASAAPWDVDCDSPNNSTTYDVIDLEATDAADELGNDIVVVGGEGSTSVRAEASDATSISAYGTFRRAFEDRAWVLQSTVDEIASAALASYKDPRFEFRFRTRVDGLLPNQLIDITCADFGLSSESAVIRRVEMTQENSSQTLYRVQGGDRPSQLESLLRTLQSKGASAGAKAETIRGLDFENTNSEYVASASSVPNLDDMGDFSLRITFSPEDVASTADKGLVSKETGGGLGWRLQLDVANTSIRLTRTKATSNYTYSRGTGALTSGSTYTLVVVSSTTTGVTFWLDGSELTVGGGGSLGTGALDSEASNPIEVGRWSGGDYWDGFLANLIVWDIALPDTTASSVHMASVDNPPFGNDVQLIWKMDEFEEGAAAGGSGAIFDRTTNSYDGTPQNTPTGAIRTILDAS